MKIEITKHPRIPSAVELLVKNLDGQVLDSTVFTEDTPSKSVEEAKLYAETFYPNHTVEVKDVHVSDGL